MTQRNLARLLAGLALASLGGLAAAADFVIIVNKDNANAVDHEFVAKAYRGEAKSWAAGGNVNTIALPEENATRAAFDKEILGKTPSQSKTIWAQMTFSGKAVPPKLLDSDDAVIKAVADNKNAIGYVSGGANAAAVKVVK